MIKNAFAYITRKSLKSIIIMLVILAMSTLSLISLSIKDATDRASKETFANITNRQIGLKNVIILIPISSKYYAVYYNGRIPDYINRDCVNTLNEEQINEINSVIINNSYVKCIGYSRNAFGQGFTKIQI